MGTANKPPKATSNSSQNRAGLAAAFTIAWALLMGWAANRYPFPHIFPRDIDSPVLALELATDGSDIDSVLHRSEPDKAGRAIADMRLVNHLDLVFIPLYAFFLWSVARVFTDRIRVFSILVVGVALFDYIEDGLIYRALAADSPPIFIPSLIKWGLLGASFLATAFILSRSANPIYSEATKRLLAIAYLFAGVLLLIPVIFGHLIGYSYIGLAIQLFSLIVAVQFVGMLGHYFSIPAIRVTYVDDFCSKRRPGGQPLTAVKAQR